MEKPQLPKIIIWLYIILSAVSLAFVYHTGILISADSRAYFGMWPYVSAGYPFFLRGLHYVFNDNYPIAVVAIQYVAILASIYCFINFFITKFILKNYQLVILLCLLFYPVFDNNVLAVNNVSTEGISYALFLQIIYSCYLVFVKRNLKYYGVLCLLTVTLITIRGQFIFLTPLYLFIEALHFYQERKFNAKVYGLILLIPISTFIVDNTYHRVVQKQFFSTPFTWTALVSSVLFVSDESDEQYMKTEEAKTVFKLIHKQFREKGIGYKDHKYHKEPIDYNYYFFHYEFPTICNQTVQREVVNYYEGKGVPVIQSYLEAERINKQLFFSLLPVNLTKWFSLVFQSFKTGLGGVIIPLIYVIFIGVLFAYYRAFGDKLALFCVFMLLLILCNRVVVSISVHSLTRYFFYTNWIPVLLVFLGVNQLFGKQNSLKN